MDNVVKRGVLISDFNIEPLYGYLKNDGQPPSVISTVAPFGQLIQTLVDTQNKIWSDHHDFALVWTRPDGISDSFRSEPDGMGTNNKKIKYLFNKDRFFGLGVLS